MYSKHLLNKNRNRKYEKKDKDMNRKYENRNKNTNRKYVQNV